METQELHRVSPGSRSGLILTEEVCSGILAALSLAVLESGHPQAEDDDRTIRRCRWWAEMADEDDETVFWPGELIILSTLGERYPQYDESFKICAAFLADMVDWDSADMEPWFKNQIIELSKSTTLLDNIVCV